MRAFVALCLTLIFSATVVFAAEGMKKKKMNEIGKKKLTLLENFSRWVRKLHYWFIRTSYR